MLFSKPLDSDRLAAFGIMPPSHPPTDDGSIVPAFRGRIGRGGRIMFDRCDPHLQVSFGQESFPSAPYRRPRPRPSNG